MVESVLRAVDSTLPVRLVGAPSSKPEWAEPVARGGARIGRYCGRGLSSARKPSLTRSP